MLLARHLMHRLGAGVALQVCTRQYSLHRRKTLRPLMALTTLDVSVAANENALPYRSFLARLNDVLLLYHSFLKRLNSPYKHRVSLRLAVALAEVVLVFFAA